MDNPIHKQGKIYDNEKDRRKGYLAAQLRYATKLWECKECKISLLKGNKSNHLKSNRHIRNMKNYISEI